MNARFLNLALSVIACAMVIGCSPGGDPAVKPPPSKPLTSVEEDLLNQLENTPAQNRPDFMKKNMGAIMSHAQQNKTFQDRLNQIAKEAR